MTWTFLRFSLHKVTIPQDLETHERKKILQSALHWRSSDLIHWIFQSPQNDNSKTKCNTTSRPQFFYFDEVIFHFVSYRVTIMAYVCPFCSSFSWQIFAGLDGAVVDRLVDGPAQRHCRCMYLVGQDSRCPSRF